MNLVQEVETLKTFALQRQLIEHVADSITAHLADYPDALALSSSGVLDGRTVDLALGAGGQAELRFADDIYAIGFAYQQARLDPEQSSHFQLTTADGRALVFEGEGAEPSESFFGIIAPQPIAALLISTPAGFTMRAFYFYARRRYPIALSVPALSQ